MQPATRYALSMSRKQKIVPKQRTLKGLEIPVPTRGEIMKAFEKIAKPKKG
jgi:hypothetical protein